MPQYSFSSDEQLILEVDKIAEKENRSRSEMIDILLRLAVKEKTRKRNARKDNSEYNSSNLGKSHSTG